MENFKLLRKAAGALALALALLSGTAAYSQTLSIRDCIASVRDIYKVKFVYDAELPLDVPYPGRGLGWVTDRKPGAESLSLSECLDRLFDGSGIEWSRKGKHIILKQTGYVRPRRDTLEVTYANGDFLTDAETLDASKVSTDRMKMAGRTQTGLQRLDADRIRSGFAIFNSPDVIKTIQRLPGVASGTELLSGLYVHGGTGSDNLFLLDGVPLYSTSHLIGLFSSFNADVVQDVDFYKSGFPARYGGRLSSVVDVSTREGDLYEWHGNFSIGLIDGRLQLEGPLVKGRTSINFGLRRTWLDVISVPAMLIVNRESMKEGEKYKAHYAFWDMNLGITHVISDSDRLQFSFFNGMDRLPIGYTDYLTITGKDDVTHIYKDKMYSRMSGNFAWGSTTASLCWSHTFSDRLTSRTRLSYGRSDNRTGYSIEDWSWEKNDDESEYRFTEGYLIDEDNRSVVNDFILSSDFDWVPTSAQRIRFGASLQHHIYFPDRVAGSWQTGPDMKKQLTDVNSSATYRGEEFSLYAEDEINIGERLTLAPGLRYTLYRTGRKTYHSPEPRFAMRLGLGRDVDLKFSYTDMRQFVHLVRTLYLEIPTSSWLPCTEKMKPMHSRQIAGGVYARLPYDLHLEVEGFWKTMSHIYEYSGHFSLYPPIEQWESAFSEGRGRAYGAEIALGWTPENTDISIAYTLSFSERNFPEFYHDWYFDRNDFRNMLNITATHRFSNRFEIYGGWTYRTGTRVTLAEQGIDPSVSSWTDESGKEVVRYYYNELYTKPNNIRIPDYHRLDIGMNFKKLTKRGNERTWNLSIYNAYCRMNPLLATVSLNENNEYVGTAYGGIPVIPTFSYSLKF